MNDRRVDDRRVDDRQRSGAHRPRRSPLTEAVPAVLVLLTVLAVGVGVWELNRSSAGTVVASGGPGDAADPGADSAPGASPTTSASPAAGGATATPSPTTSAPVDRSQPVRVLNGTGRAGVAARTAVALRARGWTVRTGNATGAARTTVYAPSTQQAAAARALADDLGGGAPVATSGRYAGLTVLLGADYPG